MTNDFYNSLLEDMLGNHDAAHCAYHLTKLAHLIDDIIDCDKEIKQDELADVFISILVGLPKNKFFIDNHSLISGVIVSSFVNWLASNKIEEEKNNESELAVSFISRSSYSDIVSVCAAIVGGVSHAKNIAMNRKIQCASEGFDCYIKSLEQENRRSK